MQSTVLKEQCLQCSMKPIEHTIAANTVVTVFPEKKTVLSPTSNNPTLFLLGNFYLKTHCLDSFTWNSNQCVFIFIYYSYPYGHYPYKYVD